MTTVTGRDDLGFAYIRREVIWPCGFRQTLGGGASDADETEQSLVERLDRVQVGIERDYAADPRGYRRMFRKSWNELG